MAPKKRGADAEEPAAKRAKAEAKGKAKAKAKAAAPRATEAELDDELNTMIQHAKDGEFDEVFKILDKYPPYVNEKPEERMYCTIHQACYWGDLAAVKKLVEKYDADIFLPTKDGKTPVEVAKEMERDDVVKYLEAQAKKKAAPPEPAAGGRNASTDRNRITATRNDGKNDEADMELSGVKQVTLKLGADGGGILCGAALVYNGKKKKKAVCISDRKYEKAINHSGDTTEPSGRRTHTINIDLNKMPKETDKVYLTLCSCGPANLSKFARPSIELLGDEEHMIRYDLKDAGKALSTVMAVLEKSGASWVASPVGAVSNTKFCGNYKAAEKLISSDGGGAGSSGGGGAKGGGGGASLEGKKIVFTGALSTMTRAQAKAKAEAAGASVAANPSGATDILVCGSGAGTKKDQATKWSIDVWTEEEFCAAVE